jgi:hypothetical protein
LALDTALITSSFVTHIHSTFVIPGEFV